MESGEFRGRIARHIDDSEPWWPELLRPPAGAPNVLIVVLDDVGFAQLGCFGSDIDTPHLDGLAAGGIRYTNFHTTALCSPTRACVLTGRNHHSCGMGRIADLATGFPGYDARIPRSCAFLPRMLLEHGYATYGAGKWHLTPEEEAHLGARRDHWPLARGFERFYGFHGGETHQFAPTLFHDNHVVPPPSTYDEGYHVTEDIADRTIEFLTDLRHVDPAKPWMFYLATGACHSPHQAPAPWIERYRGAFDDGWDVWREATLAEQKAEGVIPDHAELSPRPDWVPPWDSLSADTRAVYARYMEAFAGFLSHTDDQIGRVVAWLDETDQLDNTLVFVLSDNGASSEGGPTGSVNDARAWNALPRTVAEAHERLDEIGGPRLHNNYPWGWTVAGNTPFKRWKRETHEGGVADPLIVHWPAGMSLEARGTLRTQYVHAIDVVPTVLEALGTDAPGVVDGVEQRPIEGTSFLYSFDEPDEPERHTTQYYEMFGCRALYHDGWKAVSYHEIQSDEPGLDRAPWELYDLRADPSECHDRAEAEPARLEAMIERWWAEADRYQVLPLDNRPFSAAVLDRPRYVGDRTLYEYWPHRAPVPEEQAANVRNRPHQVAALIEVEEGPSPFGALVVQGSVLGGWSLHLTESGTLCYVHNLSGLSQERVEADIELTPGLHALAFRYTPAVDGDPASGSLRLDGDVVGEATIESFTWSRFSLTGAGLTVGYAAEFPPSDDFVAPYRFTGKLQRVFIEVEGDRQVDAAVAAADAIAME